METQPVDLDQVYRADRLRLTRIAAAITLDRSLAEEIVHDAFVNLHRRNGGIDNPSAHLHRSVINLSLKVLRRRRVAARHLTPPPGVSSIPEIDDTWAAVAKLPPRQRAVVAMRYWEDRSEADIADILGWPLGTVKSTLHRALARLRDELREEHP